MQSAEKAKEQLDALLAVKAKTVAELEVTLIVKEKTIKEIEEIKNRVQQFHTQLEETKSALKKANDDLNATIKMEAEAKFTAEKASAELSAVKEAEAKATAELNAANAEVEGTKQKIEEIKKRVDALKTEHEAARIAATNAKDELYAARVAEGKILAEISMLKADEEKAKALTVDVNSRISELQPEIKQSPRPPLVKGEHYGKVKEEPKADEPKRMRVDEAISKTDEEMNNSNPVLERSEGKNKSQPSKRAEVYKLLDAGYSVADIAQTLDIGQGEVELLIKFRGVRR
jgi:chromosome segregation ATPase